jgi:hypothetical protein
MEDEKLKQLFHTYDTNLVEGFTFDEFLPKDRTYSQTIERLELWWPLVSNHWVSQFYKRVFSLTGIEMCDDDITYLSEIQRRSKLWWR